MNTKERLIEIIKHYKLTKQEFEKQCGLSNGYINNAPISIGEKKATAILEKYSNIDKVWLLTGEGSMLKSSDSIPTAKQSSTNGIPLVSVRAVGGFGGADFAIQEADVQDRYIIPKFKDKKVDFMIEVAGSSMQPKYNSGDVVACTVIRESQFIQWGRVHVIGTTEQGLLVKRLFGTDGNYIECRSDNENYPPFKIPLPEITGIALVVGVIRLE